MKQENGIKLTIGIIFKDNIRSIERCLKALRPLRDAVPCELILADTGSTDGSRQVAERYGDLVFDFPWINDFSAARNAVMDRASGKWFFTVDSDEYLDEDVSELADALSKQPPQVETCAVVVRNYTSYEMDGDYSDFKGAIRLLRMSTGLRYHGAIHECWGHEDGSPLVNVVLPKTILHHDGYVGLDGEMGREKRERNIKLLREKLEKEPESLVAWLQFMESGSGEPDLLEKTKQAMELVEQRKPNWNRVGAAIFRQAVTTAANRGWPELEEWIEKTEKWFPSSPFTRIDVEYVACIHRFGKSEYGECVRLGNRYLSALAKLRAGELDLLSEMYSVIKMSSPLYEQRLKTVVAYSYMKLGKFDKALELLGKVDCHELDAYQTDQAVRTMLELQRTSRVDMSAFISSFCEQISDPVPSEKRAGERKRAVVGAADLVFSAAQQERERADTGFIRYSYTLFLPLTEWDIGRAAAILEETDPDVVTQRLLAVDDWTRFPATALFHALECGVIFPLPEKPLKLDEMDFLAGRLMQSGQKMLQWVADLDVSLVKRDSQRLCWARGLALAAIQHFPWADENANVETGLALARTFAQVEKEFLPLCYAPSALSEEQLFLLPPVHRFGWYCARAFDALDAGDGTNCVRLLRAGLSVCEATKNMVKFLLLHTPQLTPQPSDELRTLAEQIRNVLARFDPDDPAVAMLKQTEAYQKVAYYIEGAAVPVMGGLVQ